MAIEVLRNDREIELVAPGSVTANTQICIQNLVVVYKKSGTTSDVIPAVVKGRIKGVTKSAAAAWTAGQKLYWDDTTEKCWKTTATSASSLCQNVVAGAAAAQADTTGTIEIL